MAECDGAAAATTLPPPTLQDIATQPRYANHLQAQRHLTRCGDALSLLAYALRISAEELRLEERLAARTLSS